MFSIAFSIVVGTTWACCARRVEAVAPVTSDRRHSTAPALHVNYDRPQWSRPTAWMMPLLYCCLLMASFTGRAIAGPRIGVLQPDKKLSVKEGSLNTSWTLAMENVQTFLFEGMRIGALLSDGKLFVKEGTLSAPWILEMENVRSFSLKGSRIGAQAANGQLFVKEGSLNAPWILQMDNVQSFALEGSRIAAHLTNGNLFVKEGTLSAQWVLAMQNVARFALEKSRIGALVTGGQLFVKEGALNAQWELEMENVDSFSLEDSRIGTQLTNGQLFVKEGALNAPWIPEMDNVRSFSLEGSRIAAHVADNKLHVKEGGLSAPWVLLMENVDQFALSGSRIGTRVANGTLFVKEGLLSAQWTLQMDNIASFVLTPPLLGFADIHNHQFANLAFGGKFIVGDAFGQLPTALDPAVDAAFHGPSHGGDIMGGFMALGPGYTWLYPHQGPLSFVGWPNFIEVTHQKVYEQWLERAVQGGLRLMVMLAVDSPALCKSINTDGRDCSDEMATIDRQIDGAYAFQTYLDSKLGGPGLGWYRIVTTPADARRVIEDGKLAVVLGAETVHLFNCLKRCANALELATRGNCSLSPCAWESGLAKYWNRGVRHFFPIHQDDNTFGAASYFQPVIQRQRNYFPDLWKSLYKAPYELVTRPCAQYNSGRCNARGLTDIGRAFIRALMGLGAIIDIDHMSDLAVSDTLAITEGSGYPVVASHAGFNRMNNDNQDHEGQLTRAELQRIHKAGGMVGLIVGQGDREDVDTYTRRPGLHHVQHLCGRTTETFAQAYYWALDNAPGMSLAVGTDFNSPLAQPGPRFGAAQCPGNSPKVAERMFQQRPFVAPPGKWEGMLEYPFLARGSMTFLDRSSSGARTWDFNTDGLAHVGLLPDFLADLEVLGVGSTDLAPLFRSAEGYVQMWERGNARSGQTP
jgi:microsomal dipeptidase-like Zn-dependent dipeptidase